MKGSLLGIACVLVLVGCVTPVNDASPPGSLNAGNTNPSPVPETITQEIVDDSENNSLPETENEINGVTPPEVIAPVDPLAKPTLYNLGVHFGTWNKQTNRAGDFLFRKGLFDDKIFLESAAYVVGSNGPKYIPELTFHLPEGTKIVSPVNGTVFKIDKLYSDDYSVHIRTTPNSQWLVTFEHLENLTVEEGQSIEVGTILGDASTFGGVDGMAFTELVVWKGGATEMDITKACPVPLLDPSVKPALEASIRQLAKDWESYMKKDIYDETAWFAPGCMREQLTEYEAMHPE